MTTDGTLELLITIALVLFYANVDRYVTAYGLTFGTAVRVWCVRVYGILTRFISWRVMDVDVPTV